MKKAYIIVILLGAVAGATYGKNAKSVKPTDRLKNYDRGFPYETRVDRETIKGKAIHWYSDGHAVTVTPHRVNCAYLTNTVDSAVLTFKAQKKAQKKGKKDAKNIEKAVKELTKLRELMKLRNKSSASLTPLFDEAIKLFNGALEDTK